jgi:hypothetical protein
MSRLTLLTAWVTIALACLAPPARAQVRFADVTRAAGLREPLAGILGHGGAWGDVDGDGHLDLFVGGFCDRPDVEYRPARGPVPSRLLRNLGNGKFAPADQPAAEFFGRTSGAVFADLDNNGTLELYAANNARPRRAAGPEPQRSARARLSNLFRNDQGKLVDVSRDSGACPPRLLSARNVGVFDFDADGRLDLLVVEDRFTRNPRSALLRNVGNLRFVDVTEHVGLPDGLFGLGLAVADVNGDGRPDFFVPHSNRFFLSTRGGKYTEPEELKKTFAWKPLDGEDWPCGAAFGDLNRDGRLDLVLAVHGKRARNRIYLNDGPKDGAPRFRDVSAAVGMPAEVPVRCPHVEVQDFDNDGWPDVYLSAAWLDKDGTVTPLVLRNTGLRDGLPRFAAPRPVKEPMVYFPAGPSADYDNDGRLDLFLVNWFPGNHCRLLRNDSPKRHWLDVQVVGTKMNRMGIGAQVKLFRAGKPGELLGFQEVSTGYGYASGQPARCHFGLGDEARADVEVRLPGGKIVRRPGVKAGQRLVVKEP